MVCVGMRGYRALSMNKPISCQPVSIHLCVFKLFNVASDIFGVHSVTHHKLQFYSTVIT